MCTFCKSFIIPKLKKENLFCLSVYTVNQTKSCLYSQLMLRPNWAELNNSLQFAHVSALVDIIITCVYIDHWAHCHVLAVGFLCQRPLLPPDCLELTAAPVSPGSRGRSLLPLPTHDLTLPSPPQSYTWEQETILGQTLLDTLPCQE